MPPCPAVMSAAWIAASFVRRRRGCCQLWAGGGCAARYFPGGHLRSPSSVLLRHLSSAPEIQSSAKYDQQQRSGNILPWLMLSSPAEPQSRFLYRLSLDDHQFKLDKVLDLPEIAGNRCIGVSSQGHMLTVPARCSPDVVAINPLTKSRLPLPPTAALPDFQIEDALSRKHSKLLERNKEQATGDPNRFALVNSRAILSPSLDTVVLSRCFCSDFFFARCLSSSSSSWLSLSLPMFNMDFVFHKGQLFAVEYTGSMMLFKEFGSQPLYIIRDDADRYESVSTHVVETPDGEDLFLVQRGCRSDSKRPRTFDVFRLDKNNKYRWRDVNSLGGLTFFIGANQSVSVLAADFPGLQPDSIYFTDDDVPFGNSPSVLGETGFFNLRDQTFHFFQFTDEEIQLDWPPPMWYGPAAC